MGVTEILLHGQRESVLVSFIGEQPKVGKTVRVIVEPK